MTRDGFDPAVVSAAYDAIAPATACLADLQFHDPGA
jgi:hypothetical protein